MKRSLVLALLASLSLFACAADSTEPEPENVSEAKSDLAIIDDSQYCLPGEIRHCDMGPPPKCYCIPGTRAPATFTYAGVAR